MFWRICLLLLLSQYTVVSQQKIIRTLPGFPGDLPFTFETGYIGVGESEKVQLFYFFAESERSPKDDPLLLWLTGGPGCAAFSGLVYEIGPLKFNYANSSGNKPTLELNPYSWTKVANVIFLDAPVGTGFSYATTWEAYNASDTSQAADNYEFLVKWLLAHPKFQTNQLYITGDSYSGKIVPMIVQKIADGNEDGRHPPMNLQGYVLGNPVTDESRDLNTRPEFANLKGLISDKLYESLKSSCKGEYIYVNTSNAQCIKDLQAFLECTGKLDVAQILEPDCSYLSPKPPSKLEWDQRTVAPESTDFISSRILLPGPWCRVYNYLYSYIWLNDPTVQKALGIREGTIEKWVRCNATLTYTKDLPSSLEIHRSLIKQGYRVLIYSGDHDMAIPYVGTLTWIQSLNLSIAYDWTPWFVDGQVAGYTMQYTNNIQYRLTFATVKGGGHTAPEYKPKQCFAMVYRWFAYYPL